MTRTSLALALALTIATACTTQPRVEQLAEAGEVVAGRVATAPALVLGGKVLELVIAVPDGPSLMVVCPNDEAPEILGYVKTRLSIGQRVLLYGRSVGQGWRHYAGGLDFVCQAVEMETESGRWLTIDTLYGARAIDSLKGAAWDAVSGVGGMAAKALIP